MCSAEVRVEGDQPHGKAENSEKSPGARAEEEAVTGLAKKAAEKAEGRKEKPTFVEMLGFQAPDLKDQMINQTALESNVEDFLDQDANFIKTQEGYPHFFRNMQDNLSNVKFSNGSSLYNSRPFGILDFYESLAILPGVHALILQGQDELKSDLRPAGPIQENLMNTAYLEKLYVELLKTSNQKEGDGMTDYKAQQLIESDLVVSNPDKIIFLVKDMIATLNKTFKKSLNPFWIAKLDMNSINHFPFPEMPTSYFTGEKGDRSDVGFDRNFIEIQLKPSQNQTHFFPKLRDEDKNINVPPMLLVFCNLIEMLRMRENLILAMADTTALEDCYNRQKKLVNREAERNLFSEHLHIECTSLVDHSYVNFVEHGSLLSKLPQMDSGLAVDEVCPTLRANLNFRNPECIQTLTLDGGLNNLKVTLHYQIIQKQLLQNAVLSNSIVMTPYLKALAEIELLLDHGIRMPNGVLDYTKFLSGPRQAVDFERLKSIKSAYASEFHTRGGELCMAVNAHKTAVRQQIKKLWEDQRAKLGALGFEKKASESYGHQLPQPINKFTMVRLLHDYKHALVHVACRQLSRNVLEDAWRVELMHVTHRDLKHRTTYFGGLQPEHHIFRFEASHQKDTEPPFMQVNKLRLDSKAGLFDGIVNNGEDCLPSNLISTIPSLRSIYKLKSLPDERQQALSESESLFQRFNGHFDYSTVHLELLVYRNLTSQFNHENRSPRLM